MKQKQFVVNLGILIFLNLLIKPFWILKIEPTVQYELGNAAYGEYFVLLNFSFLLNILLDFGITNFNNKNIAQNNHLLEKHFSGLFMLKLMLGIVYILATLSIGLAVGYNMRYIKLLLLLGFNQFLISMVLYLRSNLLGMHLFKTDSLVSILDRFIMIGICALILWTSVTGIRIDVMIFVYAQTFSYFLTAVIAFIAVLRKTDNFSLSWNYPFFVMILKKSFPFAVLVLLMTFYNRFDAVMIERLLPDKNNCLFFFVENIKKSNLMLYPHVREIIGHAEASFNESGAAQAGIYAKAFRLLDAANMIPLLFSMQLIPVFSRMLKFNEKVDNLVKLSFTLLITPAIISVAVAWFYQMELISFINYGVTDSAGIFSLLMTCFIAISTTYIFGTLLTANGNLKQLNLMALVGISINFLLNLILIPKFKAMGAAYSGLVTQFFTAAVQLYLSYKIFKFKINWRLLGNLFVFILGVIAAGFISRKFISNFWIGMSVMCVLSGICALATGLISLKAITRFKKY